MKRDHWRPIIRLEETLRAVNPSSLSPANHAVWRLRIATLLADVDRVLSASGVASSELPPSVQQAIQSLAAWPAPFAGRPNQGSSTEPPEQRAPRPPAAKNTGPPRFQPAEAPDGAANEPYPSEIRLRGLTRTIDRIHALLDRVAPDPIAQNDAPPVAAAADRATWGDRLGWSHHSKTDAGIAFNDALHGIHRARAMAVAALRGHSAGVGALPPEQARLVAWLGYFSSRPRLALYVRVRNELQHLMEMEPRQNRKRPHAPPQIRLLPMSSLFHLSRRGGGSLLQLPLPALGFRPSGLAAVARLVAGCKEARREVLQGLFKPPCRSICRHLDWLAGSSRWAQGRIHSLSSSLERVRKLFPHFAVCAPSLRWGEAFRGRKFAHYDFVADEIVVSPALDDAAVSPETVDFIVYHELLHKIHGLIFSGPRGYAHTTAFRRDEKRFPAYAEAESALQKIAAHYRAEGARAAYGESSQGWVGVSRRRARAGAGLRRSAASGNGADVLA